MGDSKRGVMGQFEDFCDRRQRSAPRRPMWVGEAEPLSFDDKPKDCEDHGSAQEPGAILITKYYRVKEHVFRPVPSPSYRVGR